MNIDMRGGRGLIPLCLAALPLAAEAAPETLENWQSEKDASQAAWTISQLLGDDVIAGENTEVGEVTDVVLDKEGNITSIIVHSNGNQVERGYRKVEWPVKLFEPSDVLLSIAQQPSEFGKLEHSDSPQGLIGEDMFSADSVLGMSVQVEGLPYGEVEDLGIDEQGQVTSAIIDPDGVETPDYWIPSEMGWISPEWILVIPYTQSEIEQTTPYEKQDNSKS
ncbi:PRC-barrel domain-containing protein [Halomonas sp. WWR20]